MKGIQEHGFEISIHGGGACLRNKEMSKEGGNKMCIDQISLFLVRIHQYQKVINIIACVLGNEGSQATDMMSQSEGTFQGTFTDGLWPGGVLWLLASEP